MNITKDQFVEIINALVAQEERDDEISVALDKVVEDGDNRSLVFSTPLVENVIKALDYDGIISWWFWDGPKCGKEAEKYAIYIGDSESDTEIKIVIKTASDLYDYMESAR